MPEPESDFTDEINNVAAQPGFDVLLYLPESKTFRAHPVVAWSILQGDENFICAQPVTMLSWSVNDDRSVRLPSGEVICNDRYWVTADEWLAEMITNDGTPLSVEDAPTPDRSAPVLALDKFRGKFRSET